VTDVTERGTSERVDEEGGQGGGPEARRQRAEQRHGDLKSQKVPRAVWAVAVQVDGQVCSIIQSGTDPGSTVNTTQ